MNKVARIVFLGGLVAIGGAYAVGVFNPWLPQEMKVGISTASITGEGEVSLEPQDVQLQEKLQPVIGCLNSVANPLRENAFGYSQDYQKMLETPGATRVGWRFKIQVYEKNNEISRECIKSLREAIAMSPADADLDDPSKTFADTLEALIPVMNEADDYYKRNDNLDDKMEKGKALDSQLSPMFEKLFAATDRLSDTVSDRNMMLRERQLVALEKSQGKDNFSWHTLNVSIAARHAIDKITALAGTGRPDAQAVETIERDYQTAFDTAEAFARAHPDVKTSLGSSPVWFSLSSDFNSFLAQIKEFRRALAGSPDQTVIDSHLSKLVNEHNHMVRNYNMIGATRS